MTFLSEGLSHKLGRLRSDEIAHCAALWEM